LEAQKDLGAIVPEFPPFRAGLGRNDARNSSIWGLLVCAGGHSEYLFSTPQRPIL